MTRQFTFAAIGALATLAVAASIPSALAAGPACYIGATLSSQITSATTEGITFSERGAGFGALAGCTFIESEKFTLGARLLYETAREANIEGAWQAAAVLGYKINPHVEPYAIAGLAGARITYTDDIKATHSGYVGGAGVRIGLNDKISINVEATRDFLQAKDFFGSNVRPSSDVVRVGVTYNLF